ncbi:FAD dependent oxidoreductase [Pseudohyphozyma bogoriensis]|nr:FAD dependent oxidoreductase [Pseudohyphozyma bogoriensis]
MFDPPPPYDSNKGKAIDDSPLSPPKSSAPSTSSATTRTIGRRRSVVDLEEKGFYNSEDSETDPDAALAAQRSYDDQVTASNAARGNLPDGAIPSTDNPALEAFQAREMAKFGIWGGESVKKYGGSGAMTPGDDYYFSSASDTPVSTGTGAAGTPQLDGTHDAAGGSGSYWRSRKGGLDVATALAAVAHRQQQQLEQGHDDTDARSTAAPFGNVSPPMSDTPPLPLDRRDSGETSDTTVHHSHERPIPEETVRAPELPMADLARLGLVDSYENVAGMVGPSGRDMEQVWRSLGGWAEQGSSGGGGTEQTGASRQNQEADFDPAFAHQQGHVEANTRTEGGAAPGDTNVIESQQPTQPREMPGRSNTADASDEKEANLKHEGA